MRRLSVSLAAVVLLVGALGPMPAAAAPPKPVVQTTGAAQADADQVATTLEWSSPEGGGKLHKALPKTDTAVSNIIESADSDGVVAALASAKGAGLTVKSGKVHVIVEASDLAVAKASAKSVGATVGHTSAKLVQVDATPSQLKALLDAPGIARIRQPAFHSEESLTPILGQEVAASNANALQASGITGAGVKIAIIDGGFAGLAAAQAAGEIPAGVTTVDDCLGDFNTATEHGTAVTEVVHEMAPGADLTLICIADEVSLQDAETYAKANGIQIINHSVGWYNEDRGDGTGGPGTPEYIANDAVANGILWVNAAGNDGRRHWSGNFVDSGLNINLPWGPEDLNRFAANDVGQSFSLPVDHGVCAALKWDDWPGSYNDFDLFLVSPDGTHVWGSANTQAGTAPTELFCYYNTYQSGTWNIEIGRYGAASSPRFDLFVFTGPDLQYQTAAGSIADPADSPNVFAVGAQCWNATSIESFSSRGPNIAGALKPDITAQDQMSGLTYGLDTTCANLADGFAGTSSASPTVVGAAALIKQWKPSSTVDDLKSYLKTHAKDEGTAGADNTYGAGLLQLVAPPSKPTSVAGIPGNQSVQVSWTAPVVAGSGPITGYTVTTVEDNTKTCTTTGTLHCIVTGLTNGTPYTFTVTATNSAGDSLPSDASAPVTPLGVPDPPLVGAYGYETSVDVVWAAPADNGNAIDGYHVTLNPGGYTCDTDAATFTCSFSSLTNHVTFTASVTAHNSVGYSIPGTATVMTRTGSTYVPLTPNRVMDSKNSIGLTAALSPYVAATFQVTGLHVGDPARNVPDNANAVTGVLSVQDATYKGFVSITPEPDNNPTTSTINFPANDARSTGVTVPLGTSGRLSVTYGAPVSNTVHVIFEVTGYFILGTSGSSYVVLNPTRILDSRPTASSHTNVGLSGVLTTGTARTFQVTGALPAPLNKIVVPSSAIAVTGTLTVTGQTAPGYLTIGPDPLDVPDTASLFFPKGDNRATGLTVKLGAGGTLSVTFTSLPTVLGATTHAIFDVNGYFVPGTSGAMFVPVTPSRIVDSRPTVVGVHTNIGLHAKVKNYVAATFAVTGPMPAPISATVVPAGAVAITGTLTVTNQSYVGFLSLTPTPNNHPTTSNLNFPKGDNRATGVTVPLSTAGKCSVTYGAIAGATTDVIFDVTGYFLN